MSLSTVSRQWFYTRILVAIFYGYRLLYLLHTHGLDYRWAKLCMDGTSVLNAVMNIAPIVHYPYIPVIVVGHPCRFDNSSTSRGSCIFPCRCTSGCDQVTGQCLDGGQCGDDHPNGYKWIGQACQIGGYQTHYKCCDELPR